MMQLQHCHQNAKMHNNHTVGLSNHTVHNFNIVGKVQ